jgi:aldose 1-epimerase
MPVTTQTFGRHEGSAVTAFLLEDQAGLAVKVAEYGATLTELHVPDAAGRPVDIVLGFETLDGYRTTRTYFGATAGRYANRIKGACFSLDGRTYRLTRNEGDNHLHGGSRGFDKALWRGEADSAATAVRFHHRSPDGDQGYPGACEAAVEYRLTGDGRLRIEMTAVTDRPTVINMVNHAYFNLAGHDSGDVLRQRVMLSADRYTPVDEQLIPIGALSEVRGTPFDFTAPKEIGRDIGALAATAGYDHNWVLREEGSALRLCCRAEDPGSGRLLELWTTEPGVQFYTGGQLEGSESGKGGRRYARHAGFTLETQKFPDSPNRPNFPSARLDPGSAYRHVMEFRFTSR